MPKEAFITINIFSTYFIFKPAPRFPFTMSAYYIYYYQPRQNNSFYQDLIHAPHFGVHIKARDLVNAPKRSYGREVTASLSFCEGKPSKQSLPYLPHTY